jgi:hypothetical protein
VLFGTAAVFLLTYPMVGGLSGRPARYVRFRDPVDPSKPVPAIASWARLRGLGSWMRPVPQFAAWDPDKPPGQLAPDLQVVQDLRDGKLMLVPLRGGKIAKPDDVGAKLVNYASYIAYLEKSAAQRPNGAIVWRQWLPYIKQGKADDAPVIKLMMESELVRLARKCYGRPDAVGALRAELASRKGGEILAEGLRGINVAPDPLPISVLITGLFFAANLAWRLSLQRRRGPQ